VPVDVVIVTFESADHVERAIGDLGGVADVVVVDNASSDGSAARARRAGATRVVENDVNAGFAAAANHGAGLGDNALILFLNPDAWIDRDDLDRLVAVFADDPRLAVASPRISYDDGTEQRVVWPFPSTAGAWREAFGLQRLTRRSADDGFVIGACMMFRRVAFEGLGGFDTRYWLHAEETDLCRRALDAGWGVRLVESALARHVGGASSDASSSQVAEHFERGGERFVADRGSRRSLVSYRLAKLFGSAMRIVIPGSAARRSLHRRRAHRYLHALLHHPTTVGLDSPATGAAAHTLVVCSLESWDDIWRRNQFFVRELTRRDPNLRVMFVEPPFDWIHQLRQRDGSRRHRGLRSARPDARVLTLQPAKYFPRLFGRSADGSLRRQIVDAARRLGFANPTLWINDLSYAELAATTGWPSLYDITDDWLLASVPRRVRRRWAKHELSLLRDAQEVVVCSESLASTKRSQRPDLVVISNGVDVEHFTAPAPRPADLPRSPVAVYVGTLHEDRLDVELVRRVATELPDVEFALVGPDALARPSHQRLDGINNLHILGSRPYATIPGYLQHADVVIVPHLVTPFTESLDPIKAYECLVAGRPTVATPVAGFRDLDAPIRTASGAAFAAAVRDVAGGAASLPSRDVPTWSRQAQAFRSVLERARR
jgi:teichuronic acid biosynthesis glycosyltransferase TuaH